MVSVQFANLGTELAFWVQHDCDCFESAERPKSGEGTQTLISHNNVMAYSKSADYNIHHNKQG